MKTSISLLPVYNKLYDLNLSEEALEKISTKSKKINNSGLVYSFLANDVLINLASKDWTGNSVELINVAERKINKKLFPRYSVGEVKLKDFDPLKLSEEDLFSLVWGISYLETIKPNEYQDKTFYDVETIKKEIKNNLTNKFFPKEYLTFITTPNRLLHRDNDDLKRFFSFIFGVRPDLSTNTDNSSTNIPNIHRFADIMEHNDIRIGISAGTNNRWGMASANAVLIADVNKECYDFMDVGRKFYYNNRNLTNSALNARRNSKACELPRAFFLNDSVSPSNNSDVYDDLFNRNKGKETFLIDSNSQEQAIKRVMRRREKNKDKEERKTKLRKKLLARLDSVENDGKEININGVKIKNNSIEYLGQVLKCSYISIPRLLKKYSIFRNIDDLDFETLSNDFYSTITNEFEDNLQNFTLEGKIGDVDFTIENDVKLLDSGSYRRLVRMNGFRIKKDEVGDILKRSLCFSDQESFNSFVHQVSKCSLLTHKYLDEGIQLQVYDDFRNSTITFKIPLIRKKNRTYIKIGDNEYGVSNTNRLIKLSTYTTMDSVINILLDPTIVRIGGPTDLSYIIKEGTKLHEEDKDKNKKMIERVEKLFNLETTEIENFGSLLRGYIINGKLSKYFLDIGKTNKENVWDRLRVFSYPNMQFVCMIDKGIHQTGPSNLVNRIYALHNDSLISRDVDTLKTVNQKK